MKTYRALGNGCVRVADVRVRFSTGDDTTELADVMRPKTVETLISVGLWEDTAKAAQELKQENAKLVDQVTEAKKKAAEAKRLKAEKKAAAAAEKAAQEKAAADKLAAEKTGKNGGK